MSPHRALIALTLVVAAACGSRTGLDSASVGASDASADGDASDSAGAHVLLFGGLGGTGGYEGGVAELNDTWTWDGVTWTREHPPQSPDPRRDVASAPAGAGIVLVGGRAADLLAAGPWWWFGGTWNPLGLATPSPRFSTAMASLGASAVLFGGEQDAFTPLDDTWTFDGTSWGLASRVASPPPRRRHAMASLSARVELGDTWTWDGAAWTQPTPPSSPPARWGHAMATLGDRVVLFGGSAADGHVFGDTWTWNGSTWRRESPAASPPARTGHAMATVR